ncbi:DUF4132 domain-containing protein [Anaerobacillus sp. CMMVII]|uniref:DUF4132 domain-containing protein n=1 Tax=Anaerobacillus sp. CMMVII TaxID=2755588 RepID=UPI0021B72948|nr:DUF4132 domain-containing protein [Anaerobacillus sp. CMMVII]MCT8137800.1 DUF4132 domain-containing protein [Anaerobacillus sp. CMMVII]
MKEFLLGLSNLIHEHRNFQYEVEFFDGYKQTAVLGAQLQQLNYQPSEQLKRTDNLPLSEVWREYVDQSDIGEIELLQMNYYFGLEHLFYNFDLLKDFRSSNDERKALLSELFPIEQIQEMFGWTNELTYASQINQIVAAYLADYDQNVIFSLTSKILNTMLHQIPEDEIKGQKTIFGILTSPWLDWSYQAVTDDTSFKDYFLLKYKLYVNHKFKRYQLSIEETARAFDLKLIDEDEVYKELMVRGESNQHLYQVTQKRSDIVTKYPCIVTLRDQLITRVLGIELKRGDLPTDATNLAMQIYYYEGIEYFVKILLALDKETFVRGYIYSYGNQISKKEILSHLLKACYPKTGDDETLVKELLDKKIVTEKRLLEAAMYAPQWIEMVARLLGWRGLRSAAWYFHAHVNEMYSSEKETIVAHYSPITPEDFNDGAFDIDWFKQAYRELGDERFSILYDCAKYISAGANHRRSQLFADATLGKLDLATIKKSVIEKRNKDQLLSFSLVPIDPTNGQDVLLRYEFLQQFLRESKAFGAQRRASEGKVVSIALANLARNAGYQDVIRLTWDMEALKMNEVLHYLEPKQLDEELTVQLVIEEHGKAEIKVLKNGKELKSVPAKYKKHDYIIELKEVRTELKNQYTRAKSELERSMEMGNSFTLSELEKLTQHPVIAPLIHGLVLKVNDHLGFL